MDGCFEQNKSSTIMTIRDTFGFQSRYATSPYHLIVYVTSPWFT